MTRIEPELERTVRGWLEDGVSTLPDHVFDAVVAQAPLIRQRRMGWWPPDPSTARLLAALAAVIVLAVTLVGFLLGTNVGDDDSDSTWRVFPVVQEAPLEPGRYLIDDPFPVRIGLTIPGGWTANPTRATQAELGRDGGGAGLVFTIVEASTPIRATTTVASSIRPSARPWTTSSQRSPACLGSRSPVRPTRPSVGCPR